MATYGYARCSTNENMQDISRQERELKELGVTDRRNIFKEYESGVKADRIELNKLLEIVADGDIIIATEVSRITRSTRQLCEIIELAKKKHLKLIFGTFVLDCTKQLDVMTEGMLKMMGVFAELERNMISERVKSGMRNAQAKGKKIGRPATDIDSIPAIFYKHYPKYANNEINKKEFSRLCNLSYPTIYKYLKLIETTKKED
ncbi:MAG: recombinase family protein [Clostridium butyricum]|nr:recombinase family protein [Clostridium butyricum]